MVCMCKFYQEKWRGVIMKKKALGMKGAKGRRLKWQWGKRSRPHLVGKGFVPWGH